MGWLGATGSLIIYVFFSQKYLDDDKKVPMIDFCFTAIVAIFWLSASAAWANGVINMKYAANPNNWLFEEGDSICEKQDGNFVVTSVTNCHIKYTGNYKKANISIIVGFLNFFLW